MEYRSVAHILKAEAIQMGKLEVKQALPTSNVEQISPFLLLHHFGPFEVEPYTDPLDVGPHPHRGFEPVTFLYSGGIRHKDSLGNEGILQGGDVQWMTAGRGIIHSERASKAFLEQGGLLEGIQLWVNLPQKFKMATPGYQDISAEAIPTIPGQPDGVRVRVVAGHYAGVQGPARIHSPMLIMQVDVEEGAEVRIDLPADFNAGIYLLDGACQLNENFSYAGPVLLHFRQGGQGIALKAEQHTRALLLAGAPIDEPLAQWGPYVMNTSTELLEAMRDYQQGKMGFYID